jgi:TorA maturation chaperone TorD
VSEAATAPALQPEDEARAACYGLIARLFYSAPDEAVLAQMLHSNAFEGSDAPVAAAWRELVAAAKSAFPVVLENEHTELFVGTGKSEITPYLTHYTIKYASDNPLVDIRQQLHRWGIARRESSYEPEDHIAGLCETMRFAIAMQHTGAVAFCDAVSASQKAVFYRLVARFARAFLELEREAFAML